MMKKQSIAKKMVFPTFCVSYFLMVIVGNCFAASTPSITFKNRSTGDVIVKAGSEDKIIRCNEAFSFTGKDLRCTIGKYGIMDFTFTEEGNISYFNLNWV